MTHNTKNDDVGLRRWPTSRPVTWEQPLQQNNICTLCSIMTFDDNDTVETRSTYEVRHAYMYVCTCKRMLYRPYRSGSEPVVLGPLVAASKV